MPSLSMYATELRKRAGCCGFVRAAPIFLRNSRKIARISLCFERGLVRSARRHHARTGGSAGSSGNVFLRHSENHGGGEFGNFSDARTWKIEVNKEFFRGPLKKFDDLFARRSARLCIQENAICIRRTRLLLATTTERKQNLQP